MGRFVSPCLSAVAVSCPAVWACARCRSLQAKTGGRWPGLDHYGPVSISTGPARPPIWPGSVGYIGDFWPCRASLLPCGGLSPALWGFVPARSLRGFWRASVGRGWLGWDCLRACGVYLGRRACPVSSFGLSSVDVCPASLCACPVWACFGPSGASSVCVWCPVVVWCFSSSTGQKKNGPVWVVSLWVCVCLS